MNCRKDGLWCESSLNYHFTAIAPMIYLAEALRNSRYGEDLYKTTTASGLPHRPTPPCGVARRCLLMQTSP